MVEGYVVHESMVYISQYLPILVVPSMDVMDCIWDVNSIKMFEGELLLGKGRIRKVRSNQIIMEIYNTYNFSFLFISYLFNFTLSSIINIDHGNNIYW